MENMQEAETTLLQSTEEIPNEIITRLYSNQQLSAADRQTILDLSRNTLSSFKITKEVKVLAK
jgi:hypothetical protein